MLLYFGVQVFYIYIIIFSSNHHFFSFFSRLIIKKIKKIKETLLKNDSNIIYVHNFYFHSPKHERKIMPQVFILVFYSLSSFPFRGRSNDVNVEIIMPFSTIPVDSDFGNENGKAGYYVSFLLMA